MNLPLEQQVCSLDLAKRLKELGVKQESLFYFNSKTGELQRGFTSHVDDFGGMHWSLSAFTVAELGEWLPQKYTPKRYDVASASRFKWEYELPKGAWVTAKTEADARARILIYLLENKLVTL